MTEEQFDKIVALLLSKPQSMGELYGAFDFHIGQDNLDEALDILEEVDALNWRQEPRGVHLIPVYEIRKEARTDYTLEKYRDRQRSSHHRNLQRQKQRRNRRHD